MKFPYLDGARTAYAWDWAAPVPELLMDGRYTYLVGHDTLGWEGSRSPRGPVGWTYALPDALGSVRQETDATGAVTAAREWSPLGVAVGAAQGGLGFTGEWLDAGVGLTYLRARWYAGSAGRFTSQDLWKGEYPRPQSLNRWAYVMGNPINLVDPSGYAADDDYGPLWDKGTAKNIKAYKQAFLDSAHRHNPFDKSFMNDNGFAALIATTIRAERRMGNEPTWQEDWKRTPFFQAVENGFVYFGCITSLGQLPEICKDPTRLGDCIKHLHNLQADPAATLPTVGWGNVGLGTAADLWRFSEHSPLAVTEDGDERLLSNPFEGPAVTCTSHPVGPITIECQMHAEPTEVQVYQRLGRALLDHKTNIEYVAANMERGILTRRDQGLRATAFHAALWHNQPKFAVQDLAYMSEEDPWGQIWGNAEWIISQLHKPLEIWGLETNWNMLFEFDLMVAPQGSVVIRATVF